MFNFENGENISIWLFLYSVFILKLLNRPPKTNIPNTIFNVGYGKPIKLKKIIIEIEKCLKKKSKKKKLPLQLGDVFKTHSNIKKIIEKTGYQPKINIEKGIKNYVNWYLNYYSIKE